MDFGIIGLIYIAALVTFGVAVAMLLIVRTSDAKSLTLACAVAMAVNLVIVEPWRSVGADTMLAALTQAVVLTLLGYVAGGIAAMVLALLIRH